MTAAQQAQTASYGIAFCSACLRLEPVDGNWRTLWIDPDGNLRMGPAGDFGLRHGCPDAVVVCGEGSALVLVERFLATGGFARIEISPAAAVMVETF